MTNKPTILGCGAARCTHCLFLKGPRALTPRPLSPEDLAWYYQDAESAMGVRSTHGAFVDMALTGPPSGGGGRTNGVEARAVELFRLDAVGRHRCIRTRLGRVDAATLAVLQAAYGAGDWAKAIPDPLVRADVEHALRGVAPEVVRVLPLTEAAVAHATRRQAPAGASDEPEVVQSAHGVRCAYRPAAPSPKPKKTKADPGKAPERACDRMRRHLREQPGLAGSARGFVMHAATAEDRTPWRDLLAAAAALVVRARTAAGVQDPPRQARTRSVQLLPPVARPLLASEAIDVG